MFRREQARLVVVVQRGPLEALPIGVAEGGFGHADFGDAIRPVDRGGRSHWCSPGLRFFETPLCR